MICYAGFSRYVAVIGLAACISVTIAATGQAQRAALRQTPPTREVAQYSFAPIVRTAAPALD